MFYRLISVTLNTSANSNCKDKLTVRLVDNNNDPIFNEQLTIFKLFFRAS